MEITLDLFGLLEQMFEKIGLDKPLIVEDANHTHPAKYSVVIGFDQSNMPYPVRFGAHQMPHNFYGDDPRSADLAKRKAILSMVEQLRKTYGIQIHDISHLKNKECESRFLEVFSSLDQMKGKFSDFLGKYADSINQLHGVLTVASEQHGIMVDAVIASADEIFQTSLAFIHDVRKRLVNYADHENAYRVNMEAAARKNPLMGPIRVWNIPEKEVLSIVLNKIGLSEARYSSEIVGDDLFIGVCKLNIGSCFGENQTGTTKIKGCLEKTPYEAECSAAMATMRYLDRCRGVHIVDFNYDIMLLHKKQLSSLIRKRSSLDELFGQANKSWAAFVSNVQEFIHKHFRQMQTVSLSDEDSEEWAAKFQLLCSLDHAVSSVREMHYNAVYTVAANSD